MRARCGEPGFARYFMAALLGVAATYAVGVAYLYVILNFWVQQEGATFFKVFSIGFLSTAGGRRREGRGRRDCGGETVARWDWKIKRGALRKLRV